LCQTEGVAGWRPIAAFPEFGVPPQVPPSQPPVYSTSATNTNAVWGFICGILSVTCCCLGLPVGAVGIILSSIGLTQINNNPSQKGRGFAIAGLVLSIIGVIVWMGGGIIGRFPHQNFHFNRHWNFN
jgi:hypothetical protein